MYDESVDSHYETTLQTIWDNSYWRCSEYI